ncbi:MAG: Na+/H+ antiporter subunit G [Proteobacteria bacterium]|nr:MAG: Na+/H+ antiporter subunit G [Pseudomonadota bacterium]
MPGFIEFMVAFLVLLGAVFTFLGSLALVKLPDFFMRLHGPTKASTLGIGAILLASALYFTLLTDTPGVHEVLVTVFLFITAPVSAHMMAKAALHLKLKQHDRTRNPVHYDERYGEDKL